MKQLLILSGKGGTGKTTIASAFIQLSRAQAYADCDVDAPNLHLITQQADKPIKSDYYGLAKAQIDLSLCVQCGLCKQSCQFEAISSHNHYSVDPFACEGCGVCQAICPTMAITLEPYVAGDLMLYLNQKMTFSTAQLKMGSGTTGLLVSEVKKQLTASAASDTPLAIIDGSPGIGCPVLASLSGVDMVLIVAEPSLSGISDMNRIVKTAARFGTKMVICINKYDTNLENTDAIERYCEKNDLHFVGKIPFDLEAVKAINHSQTIVDIDCLSGIAVKSVYEKTLDQLYLTH